VARELVWRDKHSPVKGILGPVLEEEFLAADRTSEPAEAHDR
jgi:hypothetical protein